jgi:hypothetical protein
MRATLRRLTASGWSGPSPFRHPDHPTATIFDGRNHSPAREEINLAPVRNSTAGYSSKPDPSFMVTLRDIPTSRSFDFGGRHFAGEIRTRGPSLALKRGDAVDEIVADFPAVGARQRVEAAIAFINAHPEEIERHLAAGARAWQEARKLNPAEFVERTRRFREKRVLTPA